MNNLDGSTLAQKVAESIASKISEGVFQPGQRLVESDLTEYFNISRSPIREALFILENQGVVEKIPRKGVRVKQISLKDIHDLYDVVYNLTDFALKKGMELDKEKELEGMERILDKMDETIEHRDVKKCHEFVEQLHLELIQFSDNKVLIDMYLNLNLRWTTFRYLTLSHPISLKRSVAEYRNIVLGLKDKDVQKVSEILQMKKERGIAILQNIFS